MKVTEHDEFLVMITKLGFVNCFLVVEDDGVTLVDALAHGSGQGILEAVSQTGRPLKRVLMTHAHSDHIGSLDEVIAASDQVDFLVIVRCDSAHPHHRVANVPDGPTWNDTTLGRVLGLAAHVVDAPIFWALQQNQWVIAVEWALGSPSGI